MATGLITSPTTWALGTVLSPDWLQTAQDDINLFFAGIKPTTGVISATIPSPATTQGVLYKDLVPFALCSATGGGVATFRSGFNIQSVVRSSAGTYNVTFQRACAGPAATLCFANVDGTLVGFATAIATSTTVVQIVTRAAATGTATDGDFHLVVYSQ